MRDPRWIEFVEKGTSASGKTKVWLVMPKGEVNTYMALGSIKWYGPWRKYCFFSMWFMEPRYTIFEWDCLRDIADFIQERTNENRKEHKGRGQSRSLGSSE